MQIYTSDTAPKYILGHRCTIGHWGNRKLSWNRMEEFATCGGCGNLYFPDPEKYGFRSLGEAIQADIDQAAIQSERIQT